MARQSRNQARLLSLSFLVAAVILIGSEGRSDVIPSFGALGVDIPRDSKPPESMPVWVDCYCVTHGTIEPCAKAVALSMRDEECEGSPGHPCGHQQDRHSPHSPLDADSWWEKAGFLTDTREPDLKLKATFGGVLPEDPLVLNLKYTAGQVSGRYDVTAVFSSPPPRHYFLTPEDTPPGECDSHSSCTEALVVSVSYPGLEELPPPILTNVDEATGRTVYVPWLRCGKTGSGGTSACTPEADNAYNWPAHPTVHWMTPRMKEALKDLAWAWFRACSAIARTDDGSGRVVRPQSIVYTDASLPAGGLLDVEGAWKPSNLGEKGTYTHWTHRKGTAADISRLSLSLGRCGPDNWMRTRLHQEDGAIVRRAGLCFISTPEQDPNHVMVECGEPK